MDAVVAAAMENDDVTRYAVGVVAVTAAVVAISLVWYVVRRRG